MTWDNLQTLFDYDLWANSRWLAYLADKGFEEPSRSIFHHIYSAQKIWQLRIQGEACATFPTIELNLEEISHINSEWKLLLSGDDREFAFRRLNGEELTRWVSVIAVHVVNHGTYHRGELRGLARAAGLEDFPETDFMIFAAESGRGSLIQNL